jgi:hypothetical protein
MTNRHFSRVRARSARRRALASLAALAPLAFAGAIGLASALPAVAADSSRTPEKSESRDVGNFSKIDTSGAFELEINAGRPAVRVTVSGDDDIVPEVRTRVKGDVLSISLEKTHYYMSHRIVIRIDVPKLTSISASGANKISVAGLAGDSFALDGSGSTKATLAGTTGKLSVSVSGAGRVDASDLSAKTADIETSGAGHVDVSASEKLAVSISGAGKVTYSGSPVISKSISGAGKISAR